MLNTVKKSQDNYKNRPWLTFLVLVIFGTMVLAVCSILPGCGSDGTPGGSVKGKNDNAATGSKVPKMQAAIPLLTDTQGKGGRLGSLKKSPEAQGIEVFPGITQAELEKKIAADRANIDPKQMEAFPGAGITVAQLEAKIAADRAKCDPKQMEAFPGAGITRAQLEAKIAADQANIDPRVLQPPIGPPQKESN